MTLTVRYCAFVGLVLLTALVGWFISNQERLSDRADMSHDYTVSSRETVAELGLIGEVLIPSLTRGDANREDLLRTIAGEEGFTVAFYFSTKEAVEAHRAIDRGTEEVNALRAGFLGRLTRGEFTPGEELYP